MRNPVAVLFNLGYLPGGNHSIPTKGETTLQALQAASEILLEDGMINVVAYIGHEGGYEEALTVEEFIQGLSPKNWRTLKISFHNKKKSPMILVAQRCALSEV